MLCYSDNVFLCELDYGTSFSWFKSSITDRGGNLGQRLSVMEGFRFSFISITVNSLVNGYTFMNGARAGTFDLHFPFPANYLAR